MEDTSVLKLALFVGSVFGKFPNNFTLHQKFWSTLVGFWFSVSWFLGIYGTVYEVMNGPDFFYYMIPIMLNGEWLVLNAICAKNAVKHSKKWIKIFSAFAKYDRISNIVTTYKRRNLYLFATLIFLINLSLGVGHANRKFRLDIDLLRFLNWSYNINMCVVILIVIYQTLSLLDERYNQVRSDISTWITSRTIKNKVSRLMVRYAILNEISDNINEMFGGVMLMMTLNSFFIVNDLIRHLIMLEEKRNWLTFIHLFVQCILIEVVTVLVIYKYDRVEQYGKEIVKICSTYEVFNGSTFIGLTNYFEKLWPTFTADGYFVLNKQILPSMLAEITTYVIVMLQLKLN